MGLCKVYWHILPYEALSNVSYRVEYFERLPFAIKGTVEQENNWKMIYTIGGMWNLLWTLSKLLAIVWPCDTIVSTDVPLLLLLVVLLPYLWITCYITCPVPGATSAERLFHPVGRRPFFFSPPFCHLTLLSLILLPLISSCLFNPWKTPFCSHWPIFFLFKSFFS